MANRCAWEAFGYSCTLEDGHDGPHHGGDGGLRPTSPVVVHRLAQPTSFEFGTPGAAVLRVDGIHRSLAVGPSQLTLASSPPPALETHRSVIAEALDPVHLAKAPEHLRVGLRNYIERGREPGKFLCSVLDNDLRTAVQLAAKLDELRDVVMYLYWYAPPKCWGSREKRLEWQRRVGELTKGEGVSADARAQGGSDRG